MGHTYKVEAEIKVGDQIVDRRKWAIDVMKTGRARGWVTQRFNRALKFAGKDQIVLAYCRGQLTRQPYSAWQGTISGVNGRLMARRGVFERF